LGEFALFPRGGQRDVDLNATVSGELVVVSPLSETVLEVPDAART